VRSVILNADAEFINAMYDSVESITVLDPTCGSGAFLFAALNTLLPIYQLCLERMKLLVDDSYRKDVSLPHKQKFEDILDRVNKHTNEDYFILKSIIINNLFGVDIMDEAVEICKLRLFLKLISQVNKESDIEPLPDIDFNIRAGNTLVGFATEREFAGRLFAQSVLPRIKILTGSVASFRRAQLADEITHEQMMTLKERVTDKLDEIKNILDQNLMEDYGLTDLNAFRETHQPFHWFVEFYDVATVGGFDVVIGNPPYAKVPEDISRLALTSVYKTALNRWSRDENIYVLIVERSLELVKSEGNFGMILPLSITFSTKRSFKNLRTLIEKKNRKFWWSHFDRIPSALFGNDVRTRCTILLSTHSIQNASEHETTSLMRWQSDYRPHLLRYLTYSSISTKITERFSKVASQIQADTLQQLLKINKPLAVDLTNSISFTKLKESVPDFPQPCVYVGGTAYNWFPAWREIPETTDALGNPSLPARTAAYKFSNVEEADIVFAILCSSIGYWWWAVASDGFNLKKWLIQSVPISTIMIPESGKRELGKLGSQLKSNLRKQYVYKDNQGRIGNFYLPACSEDIRLIDEALTRNITYLSHEFMHDIAEFNRVFSGSSIQSLEDNIDSDDE